MAAALVALIAAGGLMTTGVISYRQVRRALDAKIDKNASTISTLRSSSTASGDFAVVDGLGKMLIEHVPFDDGTVGLESIWSSQRICVKVDDEIKTNVTDREGAVNGLATLDGTGKLTAGQTPVVALEQFSSVADITALNAIMPPFVLGHLVKVLDNGDGYPSTYVGDGASWVEIDTNANTIVVSDGAANKTLLVRTVGGADYNITLPNTVGSAGQALVASDGVGTTLWTDIATQLELNALEAKLSSDQGLQDLYTRSIATNLGVGTSGRSNNPPPQFSTDMSGEYTFTRDSDTQVTVTGGPSFPVNCHAKWYAYFKTANEYSGGVSEYWRIESHTATVFTLEANAVVPLTATAMRIAVYNPVSYQVASPVAAARLSGAVYTGKEILFVTGAHGVGPSDFVLYDPKLRTSRLIPRTWGNNSYLGAVYDAPNNRCLAVTRVSDTPSHRMLVIDMDSLDVQGITLPDDKYFSLTMVNNSNVLVMPANGSNFLLYNMQTCSTQMLAPPSAGNHFPVYYHELTKKAYTWGGTSRAITRIDLDGVFTATNIHTGLANTQSCIAIISDGQYLHFIPNLKTGSVLKITRMSLADDTLIDEFDLAVTQTVAPQYGSGVHDGIGAIWLMPQSKGPILRYDPATMQKLTEYPVGITSDDLFTQTVFTGDQIVSSGRGDNIVHFSLPERNSETFNNPHFDTITANSIDVAALSIAGTPTTDFALDADVLKKDGSVALTADWNAGAFDIEANKFRVNNGGNTTEFSRLSGGSNSSLAFPNAAAGAVNQALVTLDAAGTEFGWKTFVASQDQDLQDYYNRRVAENGAVGVSHRSNQPTVTVFGDPVSLGAYTIAGPANVLGGLSGHAVNCYANKYALIFSPSAPFGDVQEYWRIESNDATTITLAPSATPIGPGGTRALHIVNYEPIKYSVNVDPVNTNVYSAMCFTGKKIVCGTGGAGQSQSFQDWITFDPVTREIESIDNTPIFTNISNYVSTQCVLHNPFNNTVYGFSRFNNGSMVGKDMIILDMNKSPPTMKTVTLAGTSGQIMYACMISGNRVFCSTGSTGDDYIIVDLANCGTVASIAKTTANDPSFVCYFDEFTNNVYLQPRNQQTIVRVDLGTNTASNIYTSMVHTGACQTVVTDGTYIHFIPTTTVSSELKITRMKLVDETFDEYVIPLVRGAGTWGQGVSDGTVFHLFGQIDGFYVRWNLRTMTKLSEQPLGDGSFSGTNVLGTSVYVPKTNEILALGFSSNILSIRVPERAYEVQDIEVDALAVVANDGSRTVVKKGNGSDTALTLPGANATAINQAIVSTDLIGGTAWTSVALAGAAVTFDAPTPTSSPAQAQNMNTSYVTVPTTLADLTGMTVTTSNSTTTRYQIKFDCTAEHQVALGATASFILNIDGADIAGTEKTVSFDNTTDRFGVFLHWNATIATGKIVKVRVKTSTGTVNTYDRLLSIFGIA